MTERDTYLEFLDRIADELPREFFDELNGGIILRPEARQHPDSQNQDLWILGEYHKNGVLGRFINIYYGSFEKVYGHLNQSELKERLRHTVLHEFRHHLESLAGERDLEVEDAITLAQYHNMICGQKHNMRRTQDD